MRALRADESNRHRRLATATLIGYIPPAESKPPMRFFKKRPPRMFIPAKQSVGGPATFLRNLTTYLDAAGYPYASQYRRGDSIFFPIRHKTAVLDKVKKHGGQVVQRLDGVYGDDEPARRDRLARVYHDYADWVVYQSAWCKRVCDYQMGVRDSAQYRIIPNGVDGEVFYPGDNEYTGNQPVEFVVSGRFKRTDMLDIALAALDELQDKGIDLRLHIIAQYEHQTAPAYTGKSYAVVHGAQDMRGVAKLLRQSHIYIFSDANPPCPNAVLEAAASGLPVVSFDSGSLAELLPFGTPLLATASGGLIKPNENFHADALAEKLLLAVTNYPQFRATALAHANDFPFTVCGDAYREVFDLATG